MAEHFDPKELRDPLGKWTKSGGIGKAHAAAASKIAAIPKGKKIGLHGATIDNIPSKGYRVRIKGETRHYGSDHASAAAAVVQGAHPEPHPGAEDAFRRVAGGRGKAPAPEPKQKSFLSEQEHLQRARQGNRVSAEELDRRRGLTLGTTERRIRSEAAKSGKPQPFPPLEPRGAKVPAGVPSEAELRDKTPAQLAEMANITRGQGSYPGRELTLQRIRSEQVRRQTSPKPVAKVSPESARQTKANVKTRELTARQGQHPGSPTPPKVQAMKDLYYQYLDMLSKETPGSSRYKAINQEVQKYKRMIQGAGSPPKGDEPKLELVGGQSPSQPTEVHLVGYGKIGRVKKNTSGKVVYGSTKVAVGYTSPKGWRAHDASGKLITETAPTRQAAMDAVLKAHQEKQAGRL